MPEPKKSKNKRKLTVCEIVKHAQIAGTERHVLSLVTNLNSDSFKTSVCTFEMGELVDILRKEGIETNIIADSHHIRHFIHLILFFLRNNFDVVHCHSGGYACIAARIAGIKKIVYTKHGIGFTAQDLKNHGFIRKFRNLLIDKCTDRYIALTDYDKVVAVKILHIDPQKIEVINNGIDASYGKMALTKHRDYPTIGTVARLTTQKGIKYLIEAIQEISKAFTNIRVVIAGSGGEETRLRQLAEALGLSDRIEFRGYVKNALEVINNLDVFVLPSLWEGFPYVLLEAMLLKKPIVATNIFGVSEIIGNNRNGLLVEPRSPSAIAQAVVELLADKQKAQRLGNAAYEKVTSNFTLKNMVLKIESLYFSMVAMKFR